MKVWRELMLDFFFFRGCLFAFRYMRQEKGVHIIQFDFKVTHKVIYKVALKAAQLQLVKLLY